MATALLSKATPVWASPMLLYTSPRFDSMVGSFGLNDDARSTNSFAFTASPAANAARPDKCRRVGMVRDLP